MRLRSIPCLSMDICPRTCRKTEEETSVKIMKMDFLIKSRSRENNWALHIVHVIVKQGHCST